jgi:molybdopterin synthase sulfur carrier subunit
VIRIRYFAWVRERVGLAEEEIEPPAGIVSVGDLMTWLSTRDEGYSAAFAAPGVVRAALDREHVDFSAPLGEAREVAFFPPMTGG